jgi:hypothetical protein
MRQPAVHGATEYTKWDTAAAEMRSNGKTVGASADNRNVYHKCFKERISLRSFYLLPGLVQLLIQVGGNAVPKSDAGRGVMTSPFAARADDCIRPNYKAIGLPFGYAVTIVE